MEPNQTQTTGNTQYTPVDGLTQQVPAQSQGSPLDILNGINWLEVGFMFLGSWALYSTIYYYRLKVKEDKTTYYDLQRQIDKLNHRTTANEADLTGISQILTGAPAQG